MSEWRECKLGDVLNFGNGKSRPKIEGKYPIYGGNGILGYANEFNYADETIILGRVGAYCGSVYYENKPIWVSDNALSAKPKEGNYTKFLYYFLKHMDLNSHAGGSSHPLITQSLLNSLDIEICTDYEEQKAIAEVLSSLDDKIDLLHRQNRTLESLAQTLFRQWFIEEAKDEWEEKALGELLAITSSKRIFYSEYVDSGVPFYRSKEIIELHNTGSTKSELFITEDRFNEIIEKFGAPQEGDILLTSVGTLGIPYRVSTDDRFYFKDGNLTWFKDFKGISSVIVFYWLKSDLGKEQLDSITIGSTQSALTISGLKEIKLAIPPKEITKRLSNELNSFDEKINQNKKQIQTLENLRDTLLPKLLSGEIKLRNQNE